MFKTKINFIDFNGEQCSEEANFFLSTADFMAMEVNTKKGLSETIKKIIEDQDGRRILKFFQDLILKSYGKKSEDGKHFYKSKEISAEFASSKAYDAFFTELVTDAKKAAAFVNALAADCNVKEISANAKTSDSSEGTV